MMTKPVNNTVRILEKQAQVGGPLSTKQKQGGASTNNKGIKSHPIRFSLLVDVYEDNFVVGGALDKVATACSTGFLPLTKKDQKNEKAAKLDNLLKKLTADLEYYFLSMLVTGNAFAELAKDLTGEPHILPCMTSEMYVKISTQDATVEGMDGKYKILSKQYVQIAGAELLSVTQEGSVEFTEEEIIHRKTVSLSNRYYGISKFAKVSQQIATLTAIDKYYNDLFDR